MLPGLDGNRRQGVFFCFVIVIGVYLCPSAVVLWTEIGVCLCSTAAPFTLFALSPLHLFPFPPPERHSSQTQVIGELFSFDNFCR